MLHITVESLLVFGLLTAKIAVAKAEFEFENQVLLSAYALSLVLLLVVRGDCPHPKRRWPPSRISTAKWKDVAQLWLQIPASERYLRKCIKSYHIFL